MNPPKSILDKSFVYTNSVKTNIRETFARIRKEMGWKTKDQAGSNNNLPKSASSTSMKPSGNVFPAEFPKKPSKP